MKLYFNEFIIDILSNLLLQSGLPNKNVKNLNLLLYWYFFSPKYIKNPITNKYVNVAVHSKITRGFMASWLIRNNVENIEKLKTFDGLGYSYDEEKSSYNIPVFKTDSFGGIGLSVRQKKNSIN